MEKTDEKECVTSPPEYGKEYAPPYVHEAPATKKEQFKKCCATNYHPYKKIPMLKWIQNYKLSFLLPDIVAGITLALLLIPQALGKFSCNIFKWVSEVDYGELFDEFRKRFCFDCWFGCKIWSLFEFSWTCYICNVNHVNRNDHGADVNLYCVDERLH